MGLCSTFAAQRATDSPFGICKSDVPIERWVYPHSAVCGVSTGVSDSELLAVGAGNSASVAGSLLLPGTLLGAVLAPISGKLFDTYGARPPIVVGSMLVVVSLLLFSGYSAALTTLLFMVFYVLYALGQGLSVGNTMTNGLRQLTPELQADGNAVINTLQQLAGAVGTAIAAALVAMAQRECPTTLAESTLRGSQHAFYLLAILGVMGAVLVGVMFYGREKA